MDDWRNINTAPKDGTTIKLAWFDGMDGPFDVCEMHWDQHEVNPLVSDDCGLWVHSSLSFTWCDTNGGGPTHWQLP